MNQILKIICCWTTEDRDDEERLINDRDERRRTSVPRQGVANGGPAYQTSPGSDRTNFSGSQTIASIERTREQEEEEQMNRIITRTEQASAGCANIIDVSNLDGGTAGVDVAQRARLYAEAVRRHDAGSLKRKSNGDDSAPPSTLLADIGPRMADAFTRSSLSTDELEQINAAANAFLAAYRVGPQIEYKEELVAYMSFDD